MTSSVADIAEPGAGGFWSVMRHRNYALLWTGQLISQLGDRLHWMAISLWVYQKTGSALSVSFAIMALLVGSAVVGVPAGALVDRLDRRKILVYADLIRATLVFAIPDLMERNLLLVYVVLFLISAATAFFRPAMFACIPQSVPRGSLLQANALFASMDSGTEIIGPVLAGLVVSTLGYQTALYLDGITFLASAVLVSLLKITNGDVGAVNPADVHQKGVFHSIVEGLRYVKNDKIQLGLLALVLGGYWVAGLNSLQTPMAKGVLRVTDQQFGWFQSSGGIGYVAASLLLAWCGLTLRRGHVIVAAYLLWAMAVAAVGLSANVAMLVVANFWAGFANMIVFISVATILMEYTPADKMGRTITTRQVLVALMRAVSLVGFGWVADAVGVRFSILAMATISTIGTLLAAIRFPSVWHYDGRAIGANTRLGIGVFAERILSDFFVSLVDRCSPEFAREEQVWLNSVVLAMVAAFWLVFLVAFPLQNVIATGVVAATVIAAVVVRALITRFGSSK
ncbi:MAG: MFS transporter [Armatimonadota bacterium]|nr:MFS transporter [Armatimonadota bacterium]